MITDREPLTQDITLAPRHQNLSVHTWSSWSELRPQSRNQTNYPAYQEAFESCWEVGEGESQTFNLPGLRRSEPNWFAGRRKETVLARALLFLAFCEKAPGYFSLIFSNQSFASFYLKGRKGLLRGTNHLSLHGTKEVPKLDFWLANQGSPGQTRTSWWP